MNRSYFTRGMWKWKDAGVAPRNCGVEQCKKGSQTSRSWEGVVPTPKQACGSSPKKLDGKKESRKVLTTHERRAYDLELFTGDPAERGEKKAQQRLRSWGKVLQISARQNVRWGNQYSHS